MTRRILCLFEQGYFGEALGLTKFLAARGIPKGKISLRTRHAVQVDPDVFDAARLLVPEYETEVKNQEALRKVAV